MAVATLNVKITPRRMLKPSEAAEYCGLPAKRFPNICGVPPVAMPSGERLYDKHDLDNWIEALKHGAADSDDDIIGKLG